MNMDREFSNFEIEMNWRREKRFQSLNADDFRRARLAE
jgi:hypothetical protein